MFSVRISLGIFEGCILFFFSRKVTIFYVTSPVKSVCLEICDRKFVHPKFLLRYVEEICFSQSE